MREARQIGGIDDLGMFDPPAPIALVGVRQFLDRAQHLIVGGIADRVDRDLEAVHRRAAHQVLDLRVAQARRAAGRGIVGIRLLSHAPREPSAPSANSFTPTMRR